MKPKLTERQVQRSIVRECELKGIFAAHVPNGTVLAGDRGQRGRQMEILKADGLRVGMPDLILCDHSGRTGFIECKKPGGKLSEAQQSVRDWMQRSGHKWALVDDPAGLEAVLNEWGWLQ